MANKSNLLDGGLVLPIKGQKSYLVLVIVLIFGSLMTALILQSRADKVSAIAAGSETRACSQAGGNVYAEAPSNGKRNFSACQINSGTYKPLLYGYGKNKFGDYKDTINNMLQDGYTAAETCVYLDTVGSNSWATIHALGDSNANKSNQEIQANGFAPYCVESSLTGNSLQNAGFTVEQGTISISSILIRPLGDAPNPPQPPTPPNPDPDPDPVYITVCRDGEEVQILEDERVSTDTSPPCEVDPPQPPTTPPVSGDYVTPSDIGGAVGSKNTTTTRSGLVRLGSNQSLTNTRVNGCIYTETNAQNVTIKNVYIDYNPSNCTWAIKTFEGNNVTISNVTINCNSSASKGVYIDGTDVFTIEYTNFEKCDDAMFLDGFDGRGTTGSFVRGNVIHNQKAASTAHTDGAQVAEFRDSYGTITFEENWFEYNPPSGSCCQNAAIFIAGHPKGLTANIRNNYLDRDFGTYILRCNNDVICNVENNTLSTTSNFDPATYMVHFDGASRPFSQHSIRCNRLTNGNFVPNGLIEEGNQNNSNCS